MGANVVLFQETMTMNKIPERIWLQVYGEDWWGNESPELPTDNEDVTWCVDQINGSDVEYVLASKVEELEKRIGELEETCEIYGEGMMEVITLTNEILGENA